MVVNNCGGLPLYDLATVHVLVKQGQVDRANDRVNRNLLSLGWGTATLRAFLLGLKTEHYHGSYKDQEAYAGTVVVDVDAYKMCFDEDGCCEGEPAEHSTYFVKIAIVLRATGDRVAVVSIHLDGQP
ncbi:hypothetical protein [Paraburkholderia tropica]|uniref:hypothetical protein n=1 Tax=Paraburkholderia tropica TaxID=92647 RepID=UPI002AB69739|nr:hypothetical protein [Paraburkholderia tropica]